MEINSLECGAKQIVLDSSDNYEILFRNECNEEVMVAFANGESHVVTVLGYDNGVRKEQYRFSVRTRKLAG